MLSAGDRSRHRIRIERAAISDDGYGNSVGIWQPLLTRWCAVRPQFGREALEAGRLESGIRGVVTVLADHETVEITSADRGVFISGPYAESIVNIRSVLPTPEGREVELMVEEENEQHH